MPPHSQKTFKSSSTHSQTSLDVQFADRLTAADLATIIGDLVRSLTCQRKQIPLQYDAIKRDVALAAARGCGDGGEDEGEGAEEAAAENPREAARQRRAAVRLKTLGARYLKRATHYIDSFDYLVSNLESDISGDTRGDIACVSVMFGSTPVTPKEVYHVYPPRDFNNTRQRQQRSSPHPEKSRKKAALQLFRAMITDSRLFDQMGRPMNPTNMFIAVKKKRGASDASASVTPDEWLVAKPEFRNLKRGSVTEFRLSYRQEQQEVKATLLRTPTPFTSSSSSTLLEGSLTPIPMDLCTPCEPKKPRITPVRLWASSSSSSSLKLFKEERDSVKLDEERSPCGMDETPCVKRTPLYRRSCATLDSEHLEAVVKMDSGESDMSCESESDLEWFVSTQFVKGFKDPRLTSK